MYELIYCLPLNSICLKFVSVHNICMICKVSKLLSRITDQILVPLPNQGDQTLFLCQAILTQPLTTSSKAVEGTRVQKPVLRDDSFQRVNF